MAKKSDSFFIRASVDTSSSTYQETEIDLGSFVNLGVSKSTLLRVHRVAVQYLDESDPNHAINETATNSKVGWQLCTQKQSNLVYAGEDKSLVAAGSIDIFADGTRTIFVNDATDVNPAEWTNGFLVGVDTMYLGANMSNALDSGNLTIGVILEVTLETASQSSATALALSQS